MNHLDEKIYNFLDQVQNYINEINGAILARPYTIHQKNVTYIVEAAIIYNSEPLAIIQTRPFEKGADLKTSLSLVNAQTANFKYTVVTNGVLSYLHNNDRFEAPSGIQDVRELIDDIFSLPAESEIFELRKKIAALVESTVQEIYLSYTKEGKYLRKSDEILNLFNYKQIFESLIYNKSGKYFRLGESIILENNFENRLFDLFLEDLENGELIYRYASLDTIFATVNSGKMRMNGLAGMNDISEVEYVEQYLNKSYSVYENPREFAEMNRRFITCCSTLKDKLNQWRLYGDDCMGGCLVFMVANQSWFPGVRLKKVSYGSEDEMGNTFHIELELLKCLMDQVQKFTGERIVFKSLGIWKHFFKPHEYSDENEVRLLLALNNSDHKIKGSVETLLREWNLTYSHKIIAPYVNVALINDVLPIQLEKIMLGSKCPEQKLNQMQLEMLLKVRNLDKVTVVLSRIDNYR